MYVCMLCMCVCISYSYYVHLDIGATPTEACPSDPGPFLDSRLFHRFFALHLPKQALRLQVLDHWDRLL